LKGKKKSRLKQYHIQKPQKTISISTTWERKRIGPKSRRDQKLRGDRKGAKEAGASKTVVTIKVSQRQAITG